MKYNGKILQFCLLGIMCFFLFTDCGSQSALTAEDYTTVSVRPEIGSGGFQIEEIRNHAGSCIAGNSTHCYYTQYDMIPMSNAASRAEIWQYDFETKDAQLLYTYEAAEGFWLNELKATEKNLYWVLLEDGNAEIQAFSLEGKKISTIYEKKEGTAFVLTAGDEKLVWYDDVTDENGQKVELCFYDEKEKNIVRLEDEFDLLSPHDRIHVEDEICSYVRMHKNDKELVRYDLQERRELGYVQIEKSEFIESIEANQEFYIWVDEAYGSGKAGKLCVYHCKENLLEKIEVPDLNCEIFSVDLIGDQVIVNLSESGIEYQGTGGIYIYDIKERKLWKPEYDRSAGNVVIPTVIDGEYFLALNGHFYDGKYQQDTLLLMRKETP